MELHAPPFRKEKRTQLNMKIVVQRSGHSYVSVNEEVVGEIHSGLVLFVCFEKGDENKPLDKAIEKILNLRIFEDPETGKMGHNIQDIEGKILCISQFTLSWDGRKGNRPSFDGSMAPRDAQIKFRLFCEALRKKVPVEIGRFGEMMDVRIQNLGPVTFHLSF